MTKTKRKIYLLSSIIFNVETFSWHDFILSEFHVSFLVLISEEKGFLLVQNAFWFLKYGMVFVLHLNIRIDDDVDE